MRRPGLPPLGLGLQSTTRGSELLRRCWHYDAMVAGQANAYGSKLEVCSHFASYCHECARLLVHVLGTHTEMRANNLF